jgi:predicted glycoside hydrolase/deacetylase ChbG (UPF0249 family)
MNGRSDPILLIAADDYGYAPRYDEGILEAAAAGAIDLAGAMVLRDPDPQPLLETGVEIGLHLELDIAAGPAEARAALGEQLRLFAGLFGQPPAYLDGHKHCHAAPATSSVVATAGLPVRSIDPAHRRMLRNRGVATPDLLVGRLSESEPALPAKIASLLGGAEEPGVIEWMTHPGRQGGPSSFDAGREDDLELLLGFGGRRRWLERGITRRGPLELFG